MLAERRGTMDAAIVAAFGDPGLGGARELFDFLPLTNQTGVPVRPSSDPWDRLDESLDTVIPASAATPYDMHEVIRKVLDEGDFFEVQPKHAGNILCGFGRIEGRTVGVVANQPLK